MGAVPIAERFLPKGRRYGRPGYAMTPTSATIHNTANERSGADAETHARYLEAGHYISWHFTVDADSIIQHLPVSEQGWHAGTDAGNTTSIGIEVCEYPDTDEGRALQAAATDNGAWLAAKLMREIPSVKKTVTHKSWSGKECPRDILPHWGEFLSIVEAYRAGGTPPVSQPAPAPAPQPAPAHVGEMLLKSGSEGGAVRVLQGELVRHGFTHVDVDGDFGEQTNLAVRAFQRLASIGIDGKVGRDTRGSLAGAPLPRTAMPLVASAPKRVVAATRRLQDALNDITGAGLKPDGKFGDHTGDAVEAFQRRAGIDIDRVCGPQTWRALGYR